MKTVLLAMIGLLTLSCGGMLLEKETKPRPQQAKVHHPENLQKQIYLRILEQKYLHENRSMNLTIVRGMLLELDHSPLSARAPSSEVDLKEMRKRSDFLSLELTIEHLSHRQAVKFKNSRSAFLKGI